jgi:hypothetical protein
MSSNFGQIVFGAGRAILTPYATNGPALPTPIQLPIMQDLSIDFNGDMAELFGSDQFPYGLARTKVKIDCKAKIGAIYSRLLSDLFFGATIATGQTIGALDESQAVTSHSATVTHAANWTKDLGVINGSTGVPYVFKATSPGVGQYSVTAGVYTFNASDTITTAIITYAYTSNSTGFSATISQSPMGAMPTCDFVYINTQYGNNVYLEFYKAIIKKIGIPNKNTEFEMMDIEFSCFANSLAQVFYMALDE